MGTVKLKIEAELDKLLEQYRRSLRAVEYLPSFGRVPDSEFLTQIVQPVQPSRSRMIRLWRHVLQVRTRNADWFRSHFVFRYLVRMFLNSHVQSKFRSISHRLEVERLASGKNHVYTSKRLDGLIEKLRDFDKRLIDRTSRRLNWGLKASAWIWGIVAPSLATYLTTHTPTISASRVLGGLALYFLLFGMIVWLPLSVFGTLGGFRWKRLILVGQSGDMNVDIANNAVLRWAPAPQANTYESENHLFETLGLPKPNEFPWDVAFSPVTVLVTTLALAALLLSLSLSMVDAQPGWPVVTAAVVLIIIFYACLWSILRSYSRVLRDRRQRNAC